MTKKGRSTRKSRASRNARSRNKESDQAAINHDENEISGIPDRISKDRPSSEDRLREEYAYVVQDLRRIAILAILMFALLIILNLLIR